MTLRAGEQRGLPHLREKQKRPYPCEAGLCQRSALRWGHDSQEESGSYRALARLKMPLRPRHPGRPRSGRGSQSLRRRPRRRPRVFPLPTDPLGRAGTYRCSLEPLLDCLRLRSPRALLVGRGRCNEAGAWTVVHPVAVELAVLARGRPVRTNTVCGVKAGPAAAGRGGQGRSLPDLRRSLARSQRSPSSSRRAVTA